MKDPVTIVKAFNECINAQDLEGLSRLMSEDHTFIDREGNTGVSKSSMIEGWKEFFKMFPDYRNTFTKIIADEGNVYILGHAYWSAKEPYDPVIWTALVRNDLIKEWRIYEDSPENRKRFKLL